MGEQFRIIKFCTQKPLWVEGVNGKNLVNTQKPNNIKISWNDIKRNFLPASSHSNKDIFKVIPQQSTTFQNKECIFVQIASYRDPELIPTINDMLKKARYPDRLRIGICRQYHPADGFDNLDKYKKDNRFRILDIHHSKGNGVGWARNLTQRLYMGEDYTLQIDSHMRFLKDWDVILVDMIEFLQQQEYSKPLLTGYVPGYDPNKNFTTNNSYPPLKMVFDKFTPEGIVVFDSVVIPYCEQLVCPIPAQFFAGGFYFTLGKFCQEVKYDPEVYFLGEEISMAVRSFTHGYDLFHPHKTLLWHYYSRTNMTKHWDDDQTWYSKNLTSYSKLRKLLNIGKTDKGSDLTQYGLGNKRSLKEYEKYSGVVFSKMGIKYP